MYLRARKRFVFSVFVVYFNFRYSLLANESLEAYFTRVEFRKLEGSTIQTVFVDSVIRCCWKCQRLPDCVALNILAQPNEDGLHECVLLKNDTGNVDRTLTDSKFHHHYTLHFMVS